MRLFAGFAAICCFMRLFAGFCGYLLLYACFYGFLRFPRLFAGFYGSLQVFCRVMRGSLQVLLAILLLFYFFCLFIERLSAVLSLLLYAGLLQVSAASFARFFKRLFAGFCGLLLQVFTCFVLLYACFYSFLRFFTCICRFLPASVCFYQ